MILIAFILRLFIVYFQYSGDIGNHLAWADSYLNFGPQGFFERLIVGFNLPNYPSFTIYLFVLTRLLYLNIYEFFYFLNSNISLFPSFLVPLLETQNSQAAFMKVPSIFADLGIGYLIYRLTKSRLLMALFLFNPAAIYISTVWGQIESIPVFFLLLSFYVSKRKTVAANLVSHLSFTFAILSKQTALWLSPLYAILWFKTGYKKLFTGLLVQVSVFVISYLPFVRNIFDPFKIYFSSLTGSSDLISDAAWNVWSYFYSYSTADSIMLGPLSVRNWSLILLSSSFLYVCLRYYQKKIDFYTAAFYLSLAAFFLQTRVHERHLFPALVFALLLPKSLKYRLVVYGLLSLYHMLNLYASLKLPFI